MPAVNRPLGSRAIRLQGQRVTLRPVTVEDLPAVESWYPEAAGADAGACLLVITRSDDPAPIGVLDYRLGQPGEGWLTVAFVAAGAGDRGWGYGSEAVRLLEEYVASGGQAERIRADVDAGNGLGLYFWLRLGYRPARPGEVPGGASRGIISMVRRAEPRT